jgi:hypothetical protein
MVGSKIGGVNVFGGGSPSTTPSGTLFGANRRERRHILHRSHRRLESTPPLNLDNVPAGVSPGGQPTGTDNIVFDIAEDLHGHPKSASGWGHPTCPGTPAPLIAAALIVTHPVGPSP